MIPQDIQKLGRFLYQTFPESAFNSITLSFLRSITLGYAYSDHHGYIKFTQIPRLEVFTKLFPKLSSFSGITIIYPKELSFSALKII